MGMIRSSADPYILASELTKGTYDFGLSRAQKIIIGIILIVIGVVISCCVFGAIFYFVKFVIGDGGSGRSFGRSNNNNTGKSFGNNNGAGVSSYHTPAPSYNAAVAAPPPAYGGPPPSNPYVAPPANAAPPPAYGGPTPSNPYVAPPANAAPPPAYGAP